MSTHRLPALDGLRGLAVMGILLMNVAGFALPSGAYFNPLGAGPAASADLAVWAVGFVLVDGKMRALFSILFGASTAIVVGRAIARSDDPVRVHLMRMATLALFGAGHWLLLWSGDILLLYAIIGALALPFTQFEARLQLRIAVLLLAAQAAIQAMLIVDEIGLRARALAPGAKAIDARSWADFASAVGIGRPQDVAREIATMHQAWPAIVAANAHQMIAGVPLQLVFDGPETLAFMLIGMAALSSGFLRGAWTLPRYRWAALAALGIGLPLSAMLAWAVWASRFDTIAAFAAATLGGLPLRAVIALGYAAVAIPLLGGGGWFVARLRAAGRMAFSNYLGTSLMMTALFDGWGLGLFGRLHRWQCWAIVPLVWLAMLAWSAPWLARFRYGPLEWLWRSLARGAVQPMRKAIENA